MSTLPVFPPLGYQDVPCVACQAALYVSIDAKAPHLCTGCQKLMRMAPGVPRYEVLPAVGFFLLFDNHTREWVETGLDRVALQTQCNAMNGNPVAPINAARCQRRTVFTRAIRRGVCLALALPPFDRLPAVERQRQLVEGGLEPVAVAAIAVSRRVALRGLPDGVLIELLADSRSDALLDGMATSMAAGELAQRIREEGSRRVIAEARQVTALTRRRPESPLHITVEHEDPERFDGLS